MSELAQRERRLKGGVDILPYTFAGYAFECLLLTGFWFAGYVGTAVLVSFVAGIASLYAFVLWAFHSRWSLKFDDPSLFLMQQLWGTIVVLGLVFAAPQIAFQPLATLFVISAYGITAPDRQTLLLTWGLAIVGTWLAVLQVGPELGFATSTPLGLFLTSLVVPGAFVRCIAVANFGRALRERVSKQNRELKNAVLRIEQLANQDELTGLPNRRAMLAWLKEQALLSDRAGLPLSVALLDIDHFKRINDTFGHDAGDCVLQRFAAIASPTLRATDRIGRYGGEEFLVVMPATGIVEAVEAMERLLARISGQDWTAIAPGLAVRATIGVAEYRANEPLELAIRQADEALYSGKKGGRNRVAAFSEQMAAA